ncbi:hypothetical protein [Halomicronema sp. CCY15110]|uniref:hypothetical protein n=1 Tax=Halomicronema sp. CCY15110 TaxID=2767773 RepID=UPI00194F7AA9|nr:hypothetical protein [Halomicronema sp. CCY15110]
MQRLVLAILTTATIYGCTPAPNAAIPDWQLSPEVKAAYEQQQADPLSDGICSDGSSPRLTQVHGLCPGDGEYQPIENAPDGLLEPKPSNLTDDKQEDRLLSR